MLFHIVILLVALAVCTPAQTLLSLKVANETAPPGGMAQVKLFITEPKPISTGYADLLYDSFAYPSVEGIALNPGAGDASGVALVANSRIRVNLSSPLNSVGMNPDYPVLTIAMTVRKDAAPGKVMKLGLGPESWWRDLFGSNYSWEVRPGTLVVGGSMSISNIVPGGGDLPAGAVVRILGTGFQPGVKVRISEVDLADTRYIDSGEIQVVLAGRGNLTGRLVKVTNPDGSSDKYYSYLRGTPTGKSANPLLAVAIPIFPAAPHSEGTLAPLALGGQTPGTFIGFALQNPQQTAVGVTLKLVSANGAELDRSNLSLDPGTRISRLPSEIFSTAIPQGAELRVSASAPIQMMGLIGDQNTAVVLPANFAYASAQ